MSDEERWIVKNDGSGTIALFPASLLRRWSNASKCFASTGLISVAAKAGNVSIAV